MAKAYGNGNVILCVCGLARGLMENGAVIIRIERVYGGATRYTATVRVAMPGCER